MSDRLVKGAWVVNRDFNEPNLAAVAGEQLPDKWNTPQGRAYLKETFGEDSICFKSDFIIQAKDSHITDRVTKLEAENLELRERVATLEKLLNAYAPSEIKLKRGRKPKEG